MYPGTKKDDRLITYSHCNVVNVTLWVKSKPSQMKLIHKIGDAIEVLAPVIMLVLACASYLLYPGSEKSHPEELGREIKPKIKKYKADNGSASFIPFRD